MYDYNSQEDLCRAATLAAENVDMTEETFNESKFDVGKRLKLFRNRAGLSLRQLAAESGVAFTTIQKIETGAISPTVGMLMRISHGLNIRMTALLEEESDPKTVHFIRKGDRISASDRQQDIEVQYIAQNLADPKMFGFYLTVGPREGSGAEPLLHGGEEIVIGLQGAITFIIEEEKYAIHAGDCLHFKSTIPHRWKNDGKKTAKFYLICSEPYMTPTLPDQI
jgi:transcriptional regulator with XRE-family HTH domain